MSIAQAIDDASAHEMAHEASVVVPGPALAACPALAGAVYRGFSMGLPALGDESPMSAATFVRAAAGTARAGLRRSSS